MAIQKKAPGPASAPPSRAAAPGPGPGPRAVPRTQASAPASANAPQQFASLNPEDFTSGGLLDDVDVVFESCRFVEWDYNGSIDHPVLAMLVVMNYTDPATGNPATADQYYSAGELSRFYPSEDGTHAVAVVGSKGLAGGTNVSVLLKSVIDAGFPVDQFGDGNVSAMDGMVCHINRIAQPKRGGQITGKTSSGYEATVAVVTKIHQMPWETSAPAPPARPTAATAARPAATRPAPSSTANARQTAAPATGGPAEGVVSDIAEEAAGILLAILQGKGGTVKKLGIPPASFKLLAGNPNRSEILNLLADDNFLAEGGDSYGWQFDGQTVATVSA
jgi:hypothetical protein